MKKILQSIFSLTNKDNHKVINLCGIKIKIRRKKKTLSNNIEPSAINVINAGGIAIVGSEEDKIAQYKKLAMEGFEEYKKNNSICKLQIGAGTCPMDGWFNTDIVHLDKGIHYLDLLSPFPFESNSFDYIFSEHNIEHFTVDEVFKILLEAYRVLKPNGVLRMATPDLENFINYYLNESELFDAYTHHQTDIFLPLMKEKNIYSKALVINDFFRNWGHQTIFDSETLKRFLTECGFEEVYDCEIYKSDYKELDKVESHQKCFQHQEFNKLETMVIEAKKFNL